MKKIPMQPVVLDEHGTARFHANPLVRYLLGKVPEAMNQLASVDCTPEDRMQFAQLIGYSVSGYGDLSYVTEESLSKATRRAHKAIERGS